MEKRSFAKSSQLATAPIAFGAWSIGGPPFWKEADEAESVKAVETAIDLGVNLIDTAPVYGFGRSEAIVGKAIKGKRDRVVIATKFGLRWKHESLKGLYKDISAASVTEEVEESLARLGVEKIDLYQVHWPDDKTPIAETMEALKKLKEQGKIGAIGVCNFSVAQLAKAMKTVDVVSLQPCFNMLKREIETAQLPYCKENDIGIIAYSPLASGLLTGKYDADTKFDDWRGKENTGVFKKGVFEAAMEKIVRLKQVAADSDVSLLSIAIQWVVRTPGLTAAIVGANRSEQVVANLKAMDEKIPDQVWGQVEEIIG